MKCTPPKRHNTYIGRELQNMSSPTHLGGVNNNLVSLADLHHMHCGLVLTRPISFHFTHIHTYKHTKKILCIQRSSYTSQYFIFSRPNWIAWSILDEYVINRSAASESELDTCVRLPYVTYSRPLSASTTKTYYYFFRFQKQHSTITSAQLLYPWDSYYSQKLKLEGS